MSIVTSGGIEFGTETQNICNNPASLRFSPNGKRFFITSHHHDGILSFASFFQILDTSSFVLDGTVNINDISTPEMMNKHTGGACI